ncbi:MAG: phage major capsid protein [Pseudomonadota bacterium]|nr:phage major capsid protein [Pseudomonadota bacterium]QKK04371.1 MAG: phage major capsid protein [Pseudomonadota bacterium]
MRQDVKNAVGELEKAFADFKQVNDIRLKEIENKGSADPLTDVKVQRLNQEISRAQDAAMTAKQRVDVLETVLKRAPVGGNTGGEYEEACRFALELKGNWPADGGDVEQYRSYKKAFRNYLRKNNAGSDIEEIKALSAGSDPDGGYLVTPDISGRIVQLVNETSPMRQVANIVTIGTDRLEGTRDLDEVTTGWVAETDARTETDTPQIGQYAIPVHEQYAEPRATQRLLDDAMFNIEEWLAAKIADKFSRMENTAFVSGDGTGKPKGFLTYAAGVPDSTTFNVIEQVVSGAAGAFAASNPGDALINLIYSLKGVYRSNAVFMMKRATLAEVRKLKDTDGNYIYNPDMQNKTGGTLFGFPVVEAEDMPALAADSLSIAFGDFNAGYQIVDRQGLHILRDNLTAKPFVKFYTTKRVGGDVVNFEAIKLMKFAAV